MTGRAWATTEGFPGENGRRVTPRASLRCGKDGMVAVGLCVLSKPTAQCNIYTGYALSIKKSDLSSPSLPLVRLLMFCKQT